MRIVVTGISGLLGPYISEELKIRYPNAEIIGLYNSKKPIYKNCKNLKIDITNKSELSSIPVPINLLIHCAALTNHKICEKKPNLAHKINVLGTKNIVDIAKKNNAKLVYISSEAIFFNKNFANENDTPNPTTVYAKTKLEGESESQNYENSLILRTTM